MATVKAQISRSSGDPTLITVLWEGLANGDVGASIPINYLHYADRCVQVVGTFGSGGSVSMKGSNDGSTFATLTTPADAAVTFTATGLKQLLENPANLRPEVTAGDGTTDLDVYLVMRRVD